MRTLFKIGLCLTNQMQRFSIAKQIAACEKNLWAFSLPVCKMQFKSNCDKVVMSSSRLPRHLIPCNQCESADYCQKQKTWLRRHFDVYPRLKCSRLFAILAANFIPLVNPSFNKAIFRGKFESAFSY